MKDVKGHGHDNEFETLEVSGIGQHGQWGVVGHNTGIVDVNTEERIRHSEVWRRRSRIVGMESRGG